jgi:hypothetical protein
VRELQSSPREIILDVVSQNYIRPATVHENRLRHEERAFVNAAAKVLGHRGAYIHPQEPFSMRGLVAMRSHAWTIRTCAARSLLSRPARTERISSHALRPLPDTNPTGAWRMLPWMSDDCALTFYSPIGETLTFSLVKSFYRRNSEGF